MKAAQQNQNESSPLTDQFDDNLNYLSLAELPTYERLKLTLGNSFSRTLEAIEKKGLQVTHVDKMTADIRIGICMACVHEDGNAMLAKTTQKIIDEAGTEQTIDELLCRTCGCKMRYKTTLKYEPISLTAIVPGMKRELIKCPLGKW